MPRTTSLILAAAISVPALYGTAAQAAPLPAMGADQVAGTNASVDIVHWRGGGWRGGWGGRGFYGPRYGYGYGWRRPGYGGALAAGAALGIVGGAIAAGAARPYYGYPAYGYPAYGYDPYNGY